MEWTEAKCENCGKAWKPEELAEITHGIFERVQPGDLMPAGECPDCGALCHAIIQVERKTKSFIIVEGDEVTSFFVDGGPLVEPKERSKIEVEPALTSAVRAVRRYRENLIRQAGWFRIDDDRKEDDLLEIFEDGWLKALKNDDAKTNRVNATQPWKWDDVESLIHNRLTDSVHGVSKLLRIAALNAVAMIDGNEELLAASSQARNISEQCALLEHAMIQGECDAERCPWNGFKESLCIRKQTHTPNCPCGDCVAGDDE